MGGVEYEQEVENKMKTTLCDICLAEQKLTISHWTIKWKNNGLKIDVCGKHKAYKGSIQDTLTLVGKANANYIRVDTWPTEDVGFLA